MRTTQALDESSGITPQPSRTSMRSVPGALLNATCGGAPVWATDIVTSSEHTNTTSSTSTQPHSSNARRTSWRTYRAGRYPGGEMVGHSAAA